MSAENRAALKAYFETGDAPTQGQFGNLIDSFWNKLDDTLAVDWANVTSKPTTFAPSAHGHPWADISGKPTLFSGVYTDLSGKPTLATVAGTGAYSDLIGKPTLFSGAWADITSKPTTFAPSAHNHAASEVTSGVFAPARLASGTTTNGYMIQLVAGVPTWVAAPSGGAGTPAGASGQIQFNTGGAFAASSNFFWDATNNRLGIGTGSPSYALDINGTARIVTAPTITGATKMLVKDPTTGQVSEQLLPSGGSGWGFSGTAISVGQFLGTTNTEPLIFKFNSLQVAKFSSNSALALSEGAVATSAAVAIGYNTNAGDNGVAIGRESIASADGTAVGKSTNAGASYALALASGANASSTGSMAIGYASNVSGTWAAGIGLGATVSAVLSNAIGANTNVSAPNAMLLSQGGYGASNTTQTLANNLKTVFSAGVSFFVDDSTNVAKIGAASGVSLNLTEATRAMYPNRGTTTQRTALSVTESAMFYDMTLHKLFCYDGASWQACW